MPLYVPPGTEGVVMDVKVFGRRDRLTKTEDDLIDEASTLKELRKIIKTRSHN